MRYYLLAMLFILLISNIFGQNIPELNHWYFGNHCGIDFSSGAPISIPSNVNATEGTASISDQNGNLLFYTNGWKVWNKLHMTMSNGNGLLGGPSSTQNSIIVQKPCEKDHYYIFTTMNEGLPEGLNYSEVDMTLDGGLGAITSLKNVPLATPVAEKLSIIWHANEKDIWIICRETMSNRFFSYLITANGVNPEPVISYAGTVTDPTGVGYMRASLDGSLLASVNTNGIRTVDILSFDRTNGIVSDKFSFLTALEVPYGAEFSPDGNLLYVASWNEPHIYQYDLTQPNVNDVIASTTLVGTCTAGTFPIVGALQLGPDGKIYFSKCNEASLGRFENPNAPGIACGFTETAVQLNGTCEAGLPSFQMSYQYESCPVSGESSLEIPNVVTPNGDGKNDEFLIKNMMPGQVSLTILNRWGNTVYSADNYMNNWSGGILTDGVYYYLVKDKESDKTYTGFITIIR